MSQLTIRGLEPEVKKRLRMVAASKGRSMEAEARDILRRSLGGMSIEGRPRTVEELRHHLKAARGKWKRRGTTDGLMNLTRGED